MSLQLARAFDLGAFSQAVLLASGLPTTGTIYGNWSTSSGGDGCLTYLQGRDAIITTGVKLGVPGVVVLFRCDPEFAIAAGRSLAYANAFTVQALVPGQWNPETGVQKLYGAVASENLLEINPDTLVCNASSAFTGPNGAFRYSAPRGPALVPGAEGNWSPTNNSPRGVCFEFLTDGIPGETLAVGPGVYPWGLYWAPILGGKLGGVAFTGAWGWVDLYTTALVGRPGGLAPSAFPRKATANPLSDVQTEASIAGDEFNWSIGGFSADADSSAAAPKGELFFYSEFPLGTAIAPVPGQVGRLYVRFADFNPFHAPSAAGIPARTHGRVRLTSRLLVPLNPQFGIPGQDYARSWWQGLAAAAYDPLRRRVLLTLHRDYSPSGGTAAKHSMGWYSRAVDPVIVTAPAARSVPRTADVATFESFVGGDLSEPAAGQVVNFTLARRSTEGELVAVPGGAGSTSALEYPPLDTDALGVAALALVADGVPLALATDYTVVAATGVVTWVTSQAGKTVLASYWHRQTDALPAHGTLLLGTAQADADGRAFAQVAYPDDDALVGTLDALTAVLG